MWINPILQEMLRHIFQSCILESNEEILELIQRVRTHTSRLTRQGTVCLTSPLSYG